MSLTCSCIERSTARSWGQCSLRRCPLGQCRPTHREAVAKGLVCKALFVFDVYPRQPTFDDIAAELAAEPERLSVLACFQTRSAAQRFAQSCEAAGAGPAPPGRRPARI